MNLTFGDDVELLNKLSDHDCELAQLDVIMFGTYCVEEVNGTHRRVDVRHVELHNGKIHRHDKVEFASVLAADPYALTLIREQQRIADAASGMTSAWARLWREALLGASTVSDFQIWKKKDPGAK